MSFSMEENKKIFKDFVTANIKRDGIDKLLEWLEQSDFYEAPASTRFHLCEAGGLCVRQNRTFHLPCRKELFPTRLPRSLHSCMKLHRNLPCIHRGTVPQ